MNYVIHCYGHDGSILGAAGPSFSFAVRKAGGR